MSFILTSNNPASIRSFLLGKVALPSVLLYRNLFKGYKTAWGENKNTLGRYAEGTIGKTLSDFLFSNDIDIEPKMENHDLFHVVLGYNTTLPNEAALHFFLIGNGKGSIYPFIAALVGFLFFPEHYDLYIDAYHRGRHSKPFVHWNVQDFLKYNLIEFQETIELAERKV